MPMCPWANFESYAHYLGAARFGRRSLPTSSASHGPGIPPGRIPSMLEMDSAVLRELGALYDAGLALGLGPPWDILGRRHEFGRLTRGGTVTRSREISWR